MNTYTNHRGCSIVYRSEKPLVIATVLLENRGVPPPAGSDCATLLKQLEAYLAGKKTELQLDILDLSCMNRFEREVLFELRKVPCGETITYGALAAKAGYPGAARAVGTVMRRNRFPLFFPCHRVVATNGIGGFMGQTDNKEAALALKRRLLRQEGVTL